jgi:predicted transcriptional regulator
VKTAKDELRDLLDHAPDDVDMETLLAEMHLRASVRRGLDDVSRGNVISHEEVKRRLNRWLESSGRERLSEI